MTRKNLPDAMTRKNLPDIDVRLDRAEDLLAEICRKLAIEFPLYGNEECPACLLGKEPSRAEKLASRAARRRAVGGVFSPAGRTPDGGRSGESITDTNADRPGRNT